MTLIREVCHHPGCKELQVSCDNNYRGTGRPFYRKWCHKHHMEMKAKSAGLSVSEYHYRCNENTAKRAGYVSVTEYLNSKHPYRKHRKEHCENRDGRLGFKCNYEIHHSSQLDTDHIDGNPDNNQEQNLQTLCKNCHIYKTHVYKDYATPGRKSLTQSKPLISKKTKTSRKSITYKRVVSA